MPFGRTILRVCAAVILVGHTYGCTPPTAAPPARDATLDVPPLATGPGSGGRNPVGGIVFGHPPAAVGTAWNVEVWAVSRAPDPGGGTQISTYDSVYRVEVLGVDGPAPARVRLHFDKNVHTYQEQPTPTVIDGKEYIVDAKAPHVRDTADRPAPEEEAQRVLDVFPDLGTRARVDEVMPDDAMNVGDRRDELASAILRVMHPRAWTMNEGSATLVRSENGHAVFTVKIEASSNTGLRLVVAGEARVRLKDARLSELALEGTYREPNALPGTEPATFKVRRTTRDAR